MSLEMLNYYKILREKNISLENNKSSAYIYDYIPTDGKNVNIKGFFENEENTDLKSFKNIEFLYSDSNFHPLKFVSVGTKDKTLSPGFDSDVYYFRNLLLDNSNYLPKDKTANPKEITTVITNITNSISFEDADNSKRNNTKLTISRNNTGLGFSTTVVPAIYNIKKDANNKKEIHWEIPYQYTDNDGNAISNDTKYILKYGDIHGNNISYNINHSSTNIELNQCIPELLTDSKIDVNVHEQGKDTLTAFTVNCINATNAIISKDTANNIKFIHEINTNSISHGVFHNIRSDSSKIEKTNLAKVFNFIEVDSYIYNQGELSNNNNYKYNNIKLKVDKSKVVDSREYLFETENQFNEYDNSHSVFTLGISGKSFIFSEYGYNNGVRFSIPHAETVKENGSSKTEFDSRMYIIIDKLEEKVKISS